MCLFVYFCFVLCFYILPHFVNFFIARFIAGVDHWFFYYPIFSRTIRWSFTHKSARVRKLLPKTWGKFIYSKYVHLEYLCTFLSSVASCVRRISRSFCTIKWVWSSQAYLIHNSLFLVDSFNCPRAEEWRLTSFKRLPRDFSSIIWIP